MKMMREATDKLGLTLSLDNDVPIVLQYDSNSDNVALNLTALMCGILPAGEINYSDNRREKNDSEPFSLTDIQYAYLIGRNAAIPLGGVPASHYTEIEVYNPDFDRLNDALGRVIACHPVMRSALTDSGRQRFLPAMGDDVIPLIDCSGQDPQSVHDLVGKTRIEMIEAMRTQGNVRPFDIRATQIENRNIRLHLCFDLMFFDLHSIKIIMRDWWEFYENPETQKTESRLNFSDYISLEKELQKSQQGERDKAYWINKIKNIPGAPELPLHQSPELIRHPVIKTLKKEIPFETINKLRHAAAQNGITLEVLFLGVYTEVLRQWSRRQDFTLTLTQNGRRAYSEGITHITGNFLQSCLLCVNSPSSDSFAERLVSLQTELLLNRWHSSFNGIQVLREMTRLNSDGRAFSLPVVFSNTLNAELEDIVSDDLWRNAARIVHTATRTPGVWLENQLMRINGELVMNWNYVDGLFPDGMAEAMFEAADKLLCACADNPSVWSQRHSMVTLPKADEKARLDANATQYHLPPTLLHESLLDAARRFPDKTAVLQGTREVSYRELVTAAHDIATQLHAQVDINPGDIIAVSLHQSPEMLAAILGVLIAGAAYVSVDPQLPEQRQHRLIERCAAKAVLTFDGNVAVQGMVIVVTTIVSGTLRPLPPTPRKQSPDDLAYVIFTSGSTGEPKGVMISHTNAVNTVADINRRFSVNSQDRVYSIAPAGFDLSVYDYFGVLGAGGSILFAAENEPADPGLWAEQIVKQGVTLWNTVPAPVKALFERAGEQLRDSSLRLVLMSGDWIPVDLPDQIRHVSEKIDVISLGGATEGSIWSIVYPVQTVDTTWKSIPYGKPLANQRFHVLNEWLEPSPKWVTGEIFIAGDGVAQGYLGDDEKTQARFFQHPRTGERLYRTGDLGRYINEGLIEILGREDNQVKINGYRIELGEIEAALLEHPSASHVVINAVTHPKSGQKQLAAYIVATHSAGYDKNRLENELRETAMATLPSYMVPMWFVLLDEMPLTPNGKIDRNALPAVWADSAAEDSRNVPADETETRLYSIWAAQLQHSDFGVTDGFFDIGGDSLHAVSLLSAVRQSFRVSPSSEQDMIESLFMNASVRDFSKILAEVALDPEEALS